MRSPLIPASAGIFLFGLAEPQHETICIAAQRGVEYAARVIVFRVCEQVASCFDDETHLGGQLVNQ
jgi:hypothetical protein